jgi:uridine kinase
MYVIGIAGGTCSGKTTLSGALEERFAREGYKTFCLHMDKFFKNPTPNTIAPITRIEYPEHNHPDSFKLDEFYSALDEAVKLNVDVVIVEGLLILYLDKVREKLDLKIFVDLKSDERLIRRIKRFMRDRGQTLDEVASRYLDTVRYRHDEFVEPSRWHADLIFNGSADLATSSDIVFAYSRSKL